MVGVVMVNVALLLVNPLTVTTTLPEVAPAGTVTVMLVSLQLETVAAVPLKVTVLLPCVAPKFVPAMVTGVPTGPVLGVRLLMVGGTVTVNATPLLTSPPTVTMTLPVVAPLGTAAVMLVELQLDTVADVPANVTVLLP